MLSLSLTKDLEFLLAIQVEVWHVQQIINITIIHNIFSSL